MPLIPDLECATDLAASRACLSASGVAMLGLGAPLRTAMPMPERARSTRLPLTTLPRAIRSSIVSAVRIARSAVVPLSRSFSRLLVAPQVTVSLVAFPRSKAGMRSSITVLRPLVQMTFIATSRWRFRSLFRLDQHAAILHHGLVGLDRHHAGRRHHLAGLDVELAVVKVALDDVTLDETFGEQAGAVRAGVVGDIELAVEIEHREREAARFDPERGAGRHLGGAAEIDTGGHAGAPR